MVRLRKVKEISREVRESLKEPYGYCYRASKNIQKELVNCGVDRDMIKIREVRVGKNGTIRHEVLQINTEAIADVEYSGSIIVDVTLDQYCDERFEKGDVKTSFGLKSEIPNINVFEFSEHPYHSA